MFVHPLETLIRFEEDIVFFREYLKNFYYYLIKLSRIGFFFNLNFAFVDLMNFLYIFVSSFYQLHCHKMLKNGPILIIFCPNICPNSKRTKFSFVCVLSVKFSKSNFWNKLRLMETFFEHIFTFFNSLHKKWAKWCNFDPYVLTLAVRIALAENQNVFQEILFAQT